MNSKIVYGTVGFGIGIFLLFNSMVCLYRFYSGYAKVMEQNEWFTSFVVTLSAAMVLIVFTRKIIRS